MGKDFPAAHHDGGDMAWPDYPPDMVVKLVPTMPAAQTDRTQLRPVRDADGD
jgi:hypothetical protein